MNFGHRLKHLRKIDKITQEELAQYLDVGRATIAGYETKGTQPSFELVCKLADYFDVSIDYLLGRTDIKKSINSIVEKKSSDTVDVNKNKTLIDTTELSPESQKDLEKYIDLLKIKDKSERNSENSDELANFD